MKRSWKKLVCLMTVAAVGMGVLTGCGGNAVNAQEFAAYAKDVNEITIPEEAGIVALGEATHGNKEFQELKLDVFAHLVETTDVRAFALEGAFGGCALANRYILYSEGTAEAAVAKLGFQIYRTDQMLELVEWMHDYNLQAAEGDKVRIYGFDMQRDFESAYLISDFYSLIDTEKAMEYSAKFDTLFDVANHTYESGKIPEAEELFNHIVKDLEEKGAEYARINEEAYAYALQGAKCMLQDIELQTGSNYSQIRDKNMAENVKWIYEREQEVYGAKLMIAGHNGHVAKAVNSAYTNMGFYLHEEMGEEYFVIGTDFYKTTCNLPTQDGRADYDFCSDDPLAAAVGGLEGNVYYLDFAEAAASTELAGVIEKAIPTGSLGESYSPMMEVMKNTYQIRIAPGELYDGMILVYEATPIAVWDYQQQ